MLKRLKNIWSLKGHYKDVEHENCAGDTDCCRIIRKCDEELGEVAGKLDTRICISLPPKNYAPRNRKDFKKSISQLGVRSRNLRVLFSWDMTRSLSKYNCMRSASAQGKKK